MAGSRVQSIGAVLLLKLLVQFCRSLCWCNCSQSVAALLQVKKAVAVLELPANPLDNLIDLLGGPDCVAEMTGRKARLVRQQGVVGGPKGGVKWEARNASGVAANATLDLINVHERQMFLNLEKRIAIISEAASAGISLHADRYHWLESRNTHSNPKYSPETPTLTPSIVL